MSRSILAITAALLIWSPAQAMSPQTADFLRSAGMDPDSEEVRLADAEGTLELSRNGDAVFLSLEKLASEGAKNGARSFVTTRTFIRRLKADFAATTVPAEGYDGYYLTLEEREFALRKVFGD